MSEYLVVKLHADQPDRASWVVADSAGQSVSMTETGSLMDAARRAQTRPIVALVPGRDVLLTRISLPVRGASKMLQVVPFALEEQLADNVSTMHFGIGPRDASGKVIVAAVKDSLMQSWLSRLDESGLTVSYLLPDTIGVPVHDGVSILIDGEDCLISDAEGRVVVADTESAAAFIAAMGFDAETITTAYLYISEADTARYAQLLSELRLTLPDLTVTELRHGALPVLAATAIRSLQPNLMQGAYARSSGRDKLIRPWRAAAVLAGVFILSALGAKALEVMSLKSELRALKNELNTIASEVLEGGRVVDPLLQLEQIAASLNGRALSGNTHFLDMLDSLGQALTTAGGSTLNKLDFRNGTMDLTLTVPSVDVLDKISGDIGSTGLSAEIQSTKKNDDDEAWSGRLRITGQQT